MTDKKIVGALLVTHGEVGKELVHVAHKIVGEAAHLWAISIGWDDDVEEAKKRISEGIARVDLGHGVIILTDMFGGTPSNLSLSFHKKGHREIITGVNLPMVIKLANQSGTESLDELLVLIQTQGKRNISVASELLGE